MKRSSLCATLLAVGAMVLTPAFGYAGEKSPAERGAEDKAAAEKAHLDKIIKEQEAAEAKATKAPPADDTAKPVDAPKAVEPAPVAPATAPSAALPATELNLRPGAEVLVVFKASAVRWRRVGQSDTGSDSAAGQESS